MAIIKVADLGISSGVATPAFEAYISGSDQSLTDATTTKIEFNTEILDTDNCYDNSTNYRFTPTVAGKYYVYSSANSEANGSSDLRRTRISIYKNGSSYRQNQFLQETERARQQNPYVAAIMDMNGTSDYLEIFVYVDDNSGNPVLKGGSAKQTYFGAYRIIGA